MIFVDNALADAIRREGERAYPNECCGVLLGDIDENDHKVLHLIEPIVNSREEGEQYHRFLITPEDIMRAEQKARSLKMDVLGFYHSHPDCPAKPSDYDKEHALPFYSYIILSVFEGVAGETTSWELDSDRAGFHVEEIKEG
ncbi:MAG: M67 family metallopeptidase [Lachnospiraceae bacterium]|jgi:proteasome lid subunit RPN8/RPN11|nr:M67 family metallopeptidase [Lachnospiraceae bacterium]